MSGDPLSCEWCGSIWHEYGICGQRAAAYRAFESEFMKKETKFVKLPDPFESTIEIDQFVSITDTNRFESALEDARKRNPNQRDTVPVDVVNNPPHYTSSGIQPIEAVEAWGLNFNTGNAVKYISRAGKKDPNKHIEDLEKAEFYLKREIANLKKAKSES